MYAMYWTFSSYNSFVYDLLDWQCESNKFRFWKAQYYSQNAYSLDKKLNLTSLLMHDWEARAKKKIYVPILFNYVKPIKPKSLHFRLLYIF